MNLKETTKPDNSSKEHEQSQRKNNKSSTELVQLSYLKEEIKYIKKTLDILLKRKWLETAKDNKRNSTDNEEYQNKIKTNQKHRK